MYLSFYGFTQKPFQDSTHLNFLWLGETHKNILALLKNGILNTPGFLLLTGDIGTGKTILSNELIRSLSDDVIVARIPDPGLEVVDFLNCIADAFKINREFATLDAFHDHFDRLIDNAAKTGKKLLLIIDECQRVRPDLLKEIARLADMDTRQTRVLNILLIGQNELDDILLNHHDGALHQRIKIRSAIPPLDFDETAAFIDHRLTIAGVKENVFTPDAIHEIYAFSEGIPRKINIICDHALLSGFIKETKVINGEIVRECGKYFSPPDFSKKPDTKPQEPVVHSNVEIIGEETPEGIKKRSVLPVWTTVCTIVLVTIGIFFLTYIFFQSEYESLVSRIKESSIQVTDFSEETKNSPVNISPGAVSGKSANDSPDAQFPKSESTLDNAVNHQVTSARVESVKKPDLVETRTSADPFLTPPSLQNFVAEPEDKRSSDGTVTSVLPKAEEKVVDGTDDNNDFQIYSKLKEQMIQKIKADQSLESSE